MKRLAFDARHLVRSSQHGCKTANTALVSPSFNGRTAASGAAYRGSNPWGAANSKSTTLMFARAATRRVIAQRALVRWLARIRCGPDVVAVEEKLATENQQPGPKSKAQRTAWNARADNGSED